MSIITTKLGLASTTTAGPIKVATEAEAIAGVDNTKAITPATLESAVGAQVSDLDDRITNLETGGVPPAGSASQVELDATQTGAGLEANGSYSANAGANYIAAATSLKDADNKLDTQIKSNADAIALRALDTDLDAVDTRLTTAEGDIVTIEGDITSLQTADTNLQSEIDAIEGGVGLSAAGAYVQPNGSNYIDASTSVMDALDKLDAALKVVADDDSGDDAAIAALGTRVTDNETDIADHETRIGDLEAGGGMGDLQTELDDTQTGAGLDADGGYTANAGTNYITLAASLKGADELLDAQIKTNADAIALKASQADLDTAEADILTNAGNISANTTNITTNTNDITALETLADTHETAIGLNADGTYSAHTTSNYINGATSTKGALGLLDAQIKTNADDITTINTTIANLTSEGDTNSDSIVALQTELDSTQTGAGLSGNGNYTAPGASNYLGSATSLKNADDLLDAAIKDNEDDIATNVTNIATNATSITTLSGRVTTAENDITAVEGRLDTAEADITSIEGDIVTLQGVDTDLQDEINLTQTGAGLGADGSYTANAGANYISAATSLKDADNKLDAQIKTNADAIALRALDSDLDDLATRVTTAEGDITALEGRMDTAETDITALETLADTHETSLGLNADGSRPVYSSTTYISGTHHNALGQLDAQVGTNAGNITTNANDITALETLADTHETAIGLNANGTYTAPVGTNYLGAATSIRNESVKLDTQVKTNADAISTEATARANADTALQTEVDAIETAVGLSANGSKTDFSSSNYVVAAGTFKAAIEALDTQLKSTQDDLDTAEGEIDTLQTDLDTAEATIVSHTNLFDTHESSIGLNADGSYTAIVGNYATDNNLKAAVGSLDSQVKTNADNIALKASQADLNTLQTEVDAIETAVGLNANGTFNGFTTSNYMNASTSTRGALLDLDGQAKTNADAISTETTNRANADSAIQTELDNTQAGAGLAANGSYTTPAGNTYLGGASLKADIANLDTQLASTQSDLDTAEASLAAAQTDITDLETLADTHETSIGLNADGSRPNYSSNFYVANADDIVTAIGELDAAINGVAGADLTNLQDEVNAIESGAGLDADGGYTAIGDATYISAATSLKDADDRLDAALAAEATERAAADGLFDQYITKFLRRGGGIFWDDNSGDAVEMDASLTMMKSHIGPFEININDLVTSNASDIVFYGDKSYANGDKNFEVIGDGNVEFTGKYTGYPIP